MQHELMILLLSSLLLGFRHGVDWDHIAAITDLVGVESKPRQGMLLATMYSLGHGSVILVLGLTAIGIGRQLPSWLDSGMEMLVAFTLMGLGAWMLVTLIREWNGFELRSKWSIALDGLRRLKLVVLGRLFRMEQPAVDNRRKAVGHAGAFLVGIIHGFGAETPTQILLISTAAGMGTLVFGGSVVLSFVIGLILSTSLIALFAVVGFMQARVKLNVYRLVGGLTALYSFGLGFLMFVQM